MRSRATKILLQTTIPTTEDDWSIARFSLLGALLQGQRDEHGAPLYDVTMRDRDALGQPDSVLSIIDESGFDQLWLFAVDVGDGLTAEDCAAICRFRQNGRGLLVTRDHMDLGSSVKALAGIGKSHFFHTTNQDPDVRRHVIDDPYTTYISWPNFHSGANGNFQDVEVVGDLHPILIDAGSPTGSIRLLPAHPHEGGIGAPEGEGARVIAQGRSKITGTPFNIAVAFEAGEQGGRGIAQSTFHHFVDYNWDVRSGCPTFVGEAPGDGEGRQQAGLTDTHRYVLNVAEWLGGK